jgi:hypothetical protein
VHPSGKPVAQLTFAEQQELIAAYYAIQPYDEIDAACQAHDICWIMHRGPFESCNRQFSETLSYLREEFDRRSTPRKPDITFRCANLSLDMDFATNTVMDQTTSSGEADVGTWFARFFAAPIYGAIVPLWAIRNVFELPYPEPGEKCSLSKMPVLKR